MILTALKKRMDSLLRIRTPGDGRPWRFSDRAGFTLVELMVVLFLLGVLITIAVMVYFRFIYKTKETVAILHIKQIIKAQELYRAENSVYTDDFSKLNMPGTAPAGSGNNVRIYEGYRYTLSVSGGVEDTSTWSLRAEPEDGNTQMRWFYTDQTGVIRYEVGTTAGPSSPAI